VRVAFFGNIVNAHLRMARALRDEADVDAHVFTSTSDSIGWRPEADDPSMAGGRPDWVHAGDWGTAWSILAPRRAPITKALADFDLVVASGVGPVFAQHAGRPWCFYVTGGDLTVKPFPLTFWRWYPTWSQRAGQVVAGAHQRRAVRRADQLLLQPFAPMVDAADRLGIAADRRSPGYFPLPVDTERFSPDGPVDGVAADATFVVFHPSRLVLDDSPRMRRTGQWKGNDVLIRGFADLVRARVTARPRLVLIDQPVSRDREQVRRLVAELRIEDEVVWIVPPRGEHLTQPEMAALYRRADIVCGEFGIGWFGYVVLEGAASGRAVLSHVDQAVMSQMYPWHPIIDASTPGEVCRRLTELARSPGLAREAGERGRAWIEAFHAPAAVATTYRDELARIVSGLHLPGQNQAPTAPQ
jgi:glycosyltransferase involved in cell wall biosynthesis